MAEAERHQVATRFGLTLRPEFAADGGRVAPDGTRTWQWRARAWEVPFYALLHHGNVVPREAELQRGPLVGSLAVDVGVQGAPRCRVASRAEGIARVLMAEFDAPGAVYSVRLQRWDGVTGAGEVLVDLATSRGGPRTVEVRAGDLTPVLDAMASAMVAPGSVAITRDPVDLRDRPSSTWRWIHPLPSEELRVQFLDLHREMSFRVLRALVHAPEGSLRPLKSVPRPYLEPPGPHMP